jgi:uncharacterized protein
MITRKLTKTLLQKLKNSNKVIVLYGARQTGKTTFANQIIKELNLKTLKINADLALYHDVLSSKEITKLSALVEGYDMLFIDEAQRVQDIGLNLKILTDEINTKNTPIKILITGSSSLGIAQNISEALTGRKQVYHLFPFSIQEISLGKNAFEVSNMFEELMIYGLYPEVYTTKNRQEKIALLTEITSSYLYKDVLELANLRHPRKLRQLLQLLAFQIGSEVSIAELSQNLKINQETVERYLDLLEKSFVIFRLSGFSRNLRKEISKRDKFYFYDLGIRNSLIENYNYFDKRNDVGHLWENFVISERIKYLEYNNIRANKYFWRTYTSAELDFVEERDGVLYGFEIKYSKAKNKPPKTWIETYKNATYQCISKHNILDFVQ